jgi:integrase
MPEKRSSATPLTDLAMRSSPDGTDRWFPDSGKRTGHGKLYGRITKGGERLFVLRYTDPAGRYVNWPIGRYDPKASGSEDASDEWLLSRSALSLGLARKKAAVLVGMHRQGVRDLRGHFERERQIADAAQAAELARIEAEAEAARAAVRAEREREAAAEAARRDAARYNLRALCEAYVAHLERQGKASAADVRRLFAAHVYNVPDGPAGRPAREVDARDVAALLRRLVEAGKGRTAGKLRSSLRAAYALAFMADLNADVPAELIPFRIEANPVAPTKALTKYIVARERVLTASELRAYMEAVDELPQAQSDALRLALLLGGQRPAQLLRATVRDVDLEARRIVLRDPKGRRVTARVHVLPLHGDAEEIVRRLVEKARALGTDWLFTSADLDPEKVPGAVLVPTLGAQEKVVPLRLETVSAAVGGISTKLVEAKKAMDGFQMRDVRRTAETLLAALGVNRDVRAQLQSHGLSGVQDRHYDRHDYVAEKARALEAWTARLGRIKRGEREPGVTDLAEARQRRAAAGGE